MTGKFGRWLAVGLVGAALGVVFVVGPALVGSLILGPFGTLIGGGIGVLMLPGVVVVTMFAHALLFAPTVAVPAASAPPGLVVVPDDLSGILAQ